MTVCVAAICDNGKTIILVSDRMIGPGFIESEPNLNKVIKLHGQWWVREPYDWHHCVANEHSVAMTVVNRQFHQQCSLAGCW
jgi:hypothetical protein